MYVVDMRKDVLAHGKAAYVLMSVPPCSMDTQWVVVVCLKTLQFARELFNVGVSNTGFKTF